MTASSPLPLASPRDLRFARVRQQVLLIVVFAAVLLQFGWKIFEEQIEGWSGEPLAQVAVPAVQAVIGVLFVALFRDQLRDFSLATPSGPLVREPLYRSFVVRVLALAVLLPAVLLVGGVLLSSLWLSLPLILGVVTGMMVLMLAATASVLLWRLEITRITADIRAGRVSEGLSRVERAGRLLGPLGSSLRLQLHDLDQEGVSEREVDEALLFPQPAAQKIAALLLRAEQHIDRADYTSAEGLTRIALSILPHAPALHRFLAEIWLEGGTSGDALERLEAAHEIARRTAPFSEIHRIERALSSASYAWGLAHAGQNDLARKILSEIEPPDSPVARAGLAWRQGRALAAAGDLEGAKAHYTRGSELIGRGARRCRRALASGGQDHTE